MATKMNQGYLFLADISGYTSFLAKTELDHAHEILTELLEVIVNSCGSILTLSKLEGDAVFSYVFSEKVERGETLLELVEATYAAFQDRAISMHRATTCTCAACRAIPNLDLKFIVHYGDFIIQNISNIRELVGTDVNLAHRLMKNHVAEEQGWQAYALFTDRALECMGLQLEDAFPHVESYEHLGDTQTYSLNLHDSYQRMTSKRQKKVSEKDAELAFAVDFPAAPPIVWEWLNDPAKKNAVQNHNVWTNGLRPGGRTRPGARNHCAHGAGETVEVIAAWQPFNFFTSEYPLGNSKTLIATNTFELIEAGTRVTTTIKLQIPHTPRFVRRQMVKQMVAGWDSDNIALAKSMQAHFSATSAESEPGTA